MMNDSSENTEIPCGNGNVSPPRPSTPLLFSSSSLPPPTPPSPSISEEPPRATTLPSSEKPPFSPSPPTYEEPPPTLSPQISSEPPPPPALPTSEEPSPDLSPPKSGESPPELLPPSPLTSGESSTSHASPTFRELSPPPSPPTSEEPSSPLTPKTSEDPPPPPTSEDPPTPPTSEEPLLPPPPPSPPSPQTSEEPQYPLTPETFEEPPPPPTSDEPLSPPSSLTPGEPPLSPAPPLRGNVQTPPPLAQPGSYVSTPPPHTPGLVPPPPPPLPGITGTQPDLVPKTSTPTPKHKMKMVNWTKIPLYTRTGTSNVWKEVSAMDDQIPVNYDIIEQLFCQESNEQQKFGHTTKVPLLDTKKSMSIDIILKQFKKNNLQIVAMIKEGDISKIGHGSLRRLQNVLPNSDELNPIMEYNGERKQLGNAEQFCLDLQTLDGYKLRIDAMVLKLDFVSFIEKFRPLMQIFIKTCKDLMENDSLKVFLRFVLHTGNFINYGKYSGNALGFHISSLTELVNTKANSKPRITLLQFLVKEAEKKNRNSIAFVDELFPDIRILTQYTLDGIKAEIHKISTALRTADKQLEHSSEDVRSQFEAFVKSSKEELTEIQNDLGQINELSTKVAIYFCEDEQNFKLEDFLTKMKTFFENVQQCQQEN